MKASKQHVILLTGLLLFAISSCKKTELEPAGNQVVSGSGQDASIQSNDRLLDNTKLYEFSGGSNYLVIYASYTYNASSKLRSAFFSPNIFVGTYGETWNFKYNENGRLKKVKDTSPDGTDWGYWGLGYNADNTVSAVELNYGSQTDAPLYRVMAYDKAGNIKKVTSYRDSIPLDQYQFRYDGLGNLISSAYYVPIAATAKTNNQYASLNKGQLIVSGFRKIANEKIASEGKQNASLKIAFTEAKYDWVLIFTETINSITDIINPLVQQDKVFFYTTQNAVLPEYHCYMMNKLPSTITFTEYDGFPDPDFIMTDTFTYTLDKKQYPIEVKEYYEAYGEEYDSYEWNFSYVKY